jgi:hypothetical protein
LIFENKKIIVGAFPHEEYSHNKVQTVVRHDFPVTLHINNDFICRVKEMISNKELSENSPIGVELVECKGMHHTIKTDLNVNDILSLK